MMGRSPAFTCVSGRLSPAKTLWGLFPGVVHWEHPTSSQRDIWIVAGVFGGVGKCPWEPSQRPKTPPTSGVRAMAMVVSHKRLWLVLAQGWCMVLLAS